MINSIIFIVKGLVNVIFGCIEDFYQNVNWIMGDIYFRRMIICGKVDLVVVFYEILVIV